MSRGDEEENIEPLAVSIEKAEKAIGCGRTKIYELIGAKKLDARKLDSKTVVTWASIKAYASSLPAADIKPARRRQAA